MTRNTAEEAREVPQPKRRKMDTSRHTSLHKDALSSMDEALYPFRLVPSPQEARSLETSAKTKWKFLIVSGRLDCQSRGSK
jgi:hypothetical protein